MVKLLEKYKINQMKIVKELTPELVDKIIKQIKKENYDEQISKESVLHTLKQLKAQFGKIKKTYQPQFQSGVIDCIEAIDKKINLWKEK